MQKRLRRQKAPQIALKPIMAGLVTLLLSTSLSANPLLDHVAAGQVQVQQTPNSTVIHQTSQKAIINWQSFNIGAHETTAFQQPAGGIALNRINPSQGVSQIYGRLTATGQIILVNPAGIFFGPGSFVNVGGLIATTANITDQDFLDGYYRFANSSNYNGAIVNQGQLIAADNGLIALVGGAVSNEGYIQANVGHVVLASGDSFAMSFGNDGLIGFTVDSGVSRHAIDKDGLELTNGVSNTGSIVANGGQIIISAKDAAGVLDNVINMRGIAQARSVQDGGHQRDGEIIISGDFNRGIVNIGGNLDASGVKGGNITITGQNILLTANAFLDASGHTGGGDIYIGGNYQGQGPLPNAKTVSMRAHATINADATSQGNGGRVILWSDDNTNVNGSITARGGSVSGNGGFIETSSKNNLVIGNFTVDTRATHGSNGNWLLDPADLTIDTGANNSVSGSTPYQPTNTASILNVSTLTTALASSNVTVQTLSNLFSGNGDITVATPIIWNSANTLTLNSFNKIYLNADITATSGGLNLSAANITNSITSGAFGSESSAGVTANISVRNFNLLQGRWFQAGVLPTFSVSNNFQINSGTMPNVIAQFIRATGGDGTAGTPYVLTDVYGLQGMGSTTTTITQSFNLGGNIDATSTSLWNSGAGFVPIGNVANNFSGRLNGLNTLDNSNYSITNLYESQPSAVADHMGLFGQTSTATISNLNLVNATIRLNFNTFAGGILAGRTLAGTTISNATTSGTITFGVSGSPVSGFARMGGMTGENQGTITNSYTTANVSAYQSSNTFINVGGFTGNNIGTISRSYSAGNVFYSGGSFNSGRQVGGFNGANFGTINTSYSITPVVIGGSASSNLYVGGFAGQNNGGPISNSYSSGLVTNTLGGFTGGFTGQNANSFANNFYDTQSSGMGATAVGTGSGAGVTGRNTTQMMSQTTFTTGGWSSTAGVAGSITNAASTTASAPNYTWFIFEGSTRPLLMMEMKSNITNAHELQMIGSTLGGSFTLANNIDLTTALNSANSTGDVWGTRRSILTGNGFVPIGGTFTGSFNGSNRVISNLYINRSASNQVGLFAQTGGAASISDLTLTGVSINGASNVGGLAGTINAGTINHVSVAGTVTGSGSYIGGLAGYSAGTIIGNSTVVGNVTATGTGSNLGGLVGENWGTITDASYSGGTVLASGAGGSLVGGLIGYNRGSVVSNAFTANTATVTALSQAYVGGLIGQNDASVVNSYSAATVNGGSYVSGGLIGFNYGSISGNTYATGNVTGTQYVGGLMGVNQGADITPSAQGQIYATGNVSGTWEVGGLIGENYSLLSNVSYVNHTGGVFAPFADYVGGLVGLSFGSSISHSFADFTGTSVVGNSQVGGLIGGSASALSGNSYALGNVVGADSSVGGLIGYNASSVTGTTNQPIYASGNVTGHTNVGGLIGLNDTGNVITNVTVNSNVTGTSNVGGIIGLNRGALTASMPGATTVSGTVTGGINIGAIIGSQTGSGSTANVSIGTLTLEGLTGYNVFAIQTAAITGTLELTGPNTGNNTLDLSGFSDPGMLITLTAGNTGNIVLGGQSGTIQFNRIQNITVGNGDDTLRFNGGTLSGSFDAGGGNNSLIGANVTNSWTINALNGGLYSGLSGSFSNIQNITGGTGLDTFNFMEGFTLSGLIDGGDGTNLNNIRFNTYAAPLTLYLNLPTAGVFDAGYVYSASQTLISTFTRVQQSDGNSLGSIYLPNKPNITVSFYDSTLLNGEIGDPFYFYGWSIANLPAQPSQNTVNASINPNIAPIINQPVINALNNVDYAGDSQTLVNNPFVLNNTYTQPLLNNTSVSGGATCARVN